MSIFDQPVFQVTRRYALPVGVALAAAWFAIAATRSTAEQARVIPPPAPEIAAGQGDAPEVAVLAGGCFWGIQGVFQHVEGVTGAVSGYAGGDKATARYAMIGTGTTGHAEAVRITYDPRKIDYGRILQIYFSVAHDPTQLNRQGPDRGTQYRSTIFPADAGQGRVAKAYIAQLDQAKVYGAPIVTTIEPDRAFYPAEDYHQDFMTRYPTHPYIAMHDLPKIADLKRLFPERFRDKPVLVSAAKRGG